MPIRLLNVPSRVRAGSRRFACPTPAGQAIAIALLLAAVASPGHAVRVALLTEQPASSAETSQNSSLDNPPPSEVRTLDDLPWPARPGWRIASLRQRVPTIDRVVLVPDVETFLACLADWSQAGRWPILIEDDLYAPMFIRAFRPTEVLRVTASIRDRAPLPAVSNAASMRADDPSSQAFIDLLDGIAALAWTPGPGPDGAPTAAHAPDAGSTSGTPPVSLRNGAFFLESRWAPPGVVLTSTDPRDPARFAAVALAADRGQPIAHLAGDWGGPNDVLDHERWVQLRARVQGLVAATGFPWAEEGDLIDTITIARNLPARYQPAPFNGKTKLAITDGLGRSGGEGNAGDGQRAAEEAEHPELPKLSITDGLARRAPDLPMPEPPASADNGSDGGLLISGESSADEPEYVERPTRPDEPGMPRWGLAGWIFGLDEAHAIYVAMSSIFMAPDDALLFDSYDSTREPWQTYRMDVAASLLRDFGLTVNHVERPRTGISNWWEVARGGIDSELIFVNTMGNTTWFDLQNRQRAFPADVPILNHPAMVHFVHSWSAQYPASRDTVAGRWIDRGAYAYVGSVEEPYLQAFVPPNALAGRIVAGVPFLMSARQYDRVRWKIMTYGDPLAIIPPGGQPPLRVAADADGAPAVGWRAEVWRKANSHNGNADADSLLRRLPEAASSWLRFALNLNPSARDPRLDSPPSAEGVLPGGAADGATDASPFEVVDVQAAARSALRLAASDDMAWAAAIRGLVLSGRDDSAVEVFRFMMRTRQRDAGAISGPAFSAAASAALGPLYRTTNSHPPADFTLARRQALLADMLDLLDAIPARDRQPWKVDLVWSFATPWLEETEDEALLRRLEPWIRTGGGRAATVDATRLADALRKFIGADAANEMIESYRR